MKSKQKLRIFAIVLTAVPILTAFVCTSSAFAFHFKDILSIGAAYSTHLFLHETGHQAVAVRVGAKESEMHFFTNKRGNFYPGVSTYENIPEDSKLPYAAAGERTAGYTFEYALDSYQDKPTTYNKALMFFSCFDFFAYTLLSSYIKPEADMYDPNLIREETGCSKEVLLSLVTAKTFLNAYRIFNPDFKVIPVVQVDETSAALVLQVPF